MKKHLPLFLLCLGTLFCIYDFFLIASTPGTFLDNLTSFTHIWLALGLFLIFCGGFRLKNNRPFYKDWKQGAKLSASVLCGAAAAICLVNLIFILSPKVADGGESADYLLLLGGGIDKNGRLPSSVQKRVLAATVYMQKHPEVIAVATGGTLKWLPYAEAPAIKQMMMDNGIDGNRILTDEKALDTIQNFQNSCELLAQSQGCSRQDVLKSRIVVVTSFYHLARSERLAQRMGFENIRGIGSHIDFLHAPHCYLREICAYIKLNLRILLTGEPGKIA